MSDATSLTCTSINDLMQKAKINFVGKDPRSVYLRLPDMRQLSDKAKQRGDDETTYIFLKRWLHSVEWLEKTVKDAEANIYTRIITVDQELQEINKVKNTLADMRQKLDIRYKLNSKKHQDIRPLSKMSFSSLFSRLPADVVEEDESLRVQRNKNKLNDKCLDMEMDHGDNKSVLSKRSKLNSTNTVSSNESKNFVIDVTISIDDKQPSRSDNANGQRSESPESPVLTPRPKMSNKVKSRILAKRAQGDSEAKRVTFTRNPRRQTIRPLILA